MFASHVGEEEEEEEKEEQDKQKKVFFVSKCGLVQESLADMVDGSCRATADRARFRGK